MDPHIQYVTTRDGVNIAYYVIGEGEYTSLFYSIPFTNLETEWQMPLIRAAFTSIAEDMRLIRLDPRGFGLSDRDVSEFSVDAMVSDIEAAVERLGVKVRRIQTLGLGSSPAIAYAARHPETDALILQPPTASGIDFEAQRLVALQALAAVDWEFGSEAVLRSFNSQWPDPLIKEFAKWLRTCIDYDQLARFLECAQDWDVDDEARTVKAKTLLIHNRNDLNEEMHTTRRVAALFPDAHIAFINDNFEARNAIREFYSGKPAPTEATPSPPTHQSGTAVILFIDIAESTALTERMGDAAFRAASSALDARLRSAIREAGGTPVEGKVMGDGVMATFASAREAIDAALRCNALSGESELRLHIGLHAGDVIREPGNVYGGAVNIAARICDASEPGEVLVSDVVRGMARTSAGVTFEDRGEREMKGVGEPVRVYAVRAGLD
jgi:class 3 adenylate cyclase/pimeloyl-ACP methyl ester carboxylesterase